MQGEGAQVAGLEAKLGAMQAQLDRLEALLLQQQGQRAQEASSAAAAVQPATTASRSEA